MKKGFKDFFRITTSELSHIFKDRGVMLIFIVAGIVYPILYNGIYNNEAIYEIPIAVVDLSNSSQSEAFLRKLNATQEVKIAGRCNNIEEARTLFMDRKVHGVVYIPSDYHLKLERMEQATISIYNDMSSFLYYKGLMMATNFTMLDELRNIQINRYSMTGITGEQAEQLVEAIPGNDIALYNPGSGFASFLLPALLILIIHQTLFFGIGMMAGTAKEEGRMHSQIPAHLYGNGVFRVIFGKALAYFLLYIPITIYILGFIPKFFNLPHIGDFGTLCMFMIPFLLSTIFFSMAVSVFIKNRETGLITFLFFTVILLFLSGFSWPRQNMPAFWRWLSYIFPSTHGVQGYIKINSMGASLPQVRFEYLLLWLQAGAYLIAASVSTNISLKKHLQS